MQSNNFKPNTPEWHGERWKTIGSSDLPIATGFSRWTTAKDFLIRKRLRDKAPEQEMTQPMKDGQEHEPRIAELFSIHFLPNQVIPIWTPCQFRHKTIEWLSCNIDRLIHWPSVPQFHDAIVEIKLKCYGDKFPDIPSIDYIIQVHDQMKVMDQHNYCFLIYGLKTNLNACQIWRLKFNQEFWDKTIFPRATEFWNKRNLPDDATDEQLQLSFPQQFYDWDKNRISSVFSPMLIYQTYN